MHVPPIADDELLPVWVCQIPALEDHARRSIYLPQLARTLGRRTPGREFVLTDVADVLERSGLPESHWRRWYGRPEDTRLGALRRWLGDRSELVPDVATLGSLQALERALTPGRTTDGGDR